MFYKPLDILFLIFVIAFSYPHRKLDTSLKPTPQIDRALDLPPKGPFPFEGIYLPKGVDFRLGWPLGHLGGKYGLKPTDFCRLPLESSNTISPGPPVRAKLMRNKGITIENVYGKKREN